MPTNKNISYGLLAQQAERRPVKATVAGSIPAETANMVSSSKGRTQGFHPCNAEFDSRRDHH